MFVFHRNYGIERSLVIDKHSTVELVRAKLLSSFGGSTSWGKADFLTDTARVLREALTGSNTESPLFTLVETGYESLATLLQRNTSITVLPAWLLDCTAIPADFSEPSRIHEHRHHTLTTIRRNLGLHKFPKLIDIRTLAQPYEHSQQALEPAVLGKTERKALAALEGLNQLISGPQRRILRVGDSLGQLSWTDGANYITLNRKLLAACTTTHGALDAVTKLLHEYAHVQETWLTRDQDDKFYRRFYAMITDANILRNASKIPALVTLQNANRAVNDEAHWSKTSVPASARPLIQV